ncbi:MAG: alpha/beta fold hydrolase [Acidimicrobiia bacterium]|nr:alpha/beta fold hydrolase [Acidimicrobiia bacterium]
MRRPAAAYVAVVLLAAACSDGPDGGGSAGPVTSSPLAPTTASLYEPVYAPGPCDAAVPVDPRVECGTLTVPVDREAPEAGAVVLPVAVIASASPTPEPDPIVYFSGGPGAAGRGIAGRILDLDLGGPRDVIVFDQRGTGASTPGLDCPEIVEPIWGALGAPRDVLTEADLLVGAVLDCRARLVAEGVDLDAYDTPTTAADVEDLRLALGIEAWNIFGVSYGTTVALEVARSYPDAVRSVVLDSVYPTDVGLGGEIRVEFARRAVDQLVAGCAADAACAAAHGDVAAALQALVDDWDASPFVTIIDDPATGQPRPLAITGKDVVAGLWNAMYDTALIGVLPSLLAPLRERGDVARTVVAQLATDGIAQLTRLAEGVAIGVDCADRQRLGGLSDVEAIAIDPLFESLLTLGSTRRCDLWDVESVDDGFTDPVVSDLPALVLGNEYDPVTPPASSDRAAEGFANGTYVFLPGLGHGAVFEGGCPLDLFRAFVSAPTAPLDTACAASMPPPSWST